MPDPPPASPPARPPAPRPPRLDLPASSPPVLSDAEFEKLRLLARDKFGLNLTAAKRDLVAVRLGKKLRELRLPSYRAYYEQVLADATGESLVAFIDALSTNHTAFLRERDHFDFLRQTVLPLLRRRPRIDLWSAPCSTGEEAYSILITVLEELGVPPQPDVRVRAVDISTKALAVAEQGSYPESRLQGLPESTMRKYFERSAPGVWRVRAEHRRRIEFARVNLIEPLREPRLYSVVFCRNMMIYFDQATQERVVHQLARQMEPGGYLFIGHSENLIGIQHPFEYVAPAIYRMPGESKVR